LADSAHCIRKQCCSLFLRARRRRRHAAIRVGSANGGQIGGRTFGCSRSAASRQPPNPPALSVDHHRCYQHVSYAHACAFVPACAVHCALHCHAVVSDGIGRYRTVSDSLRLSFWLSGSLSLRRSRPPCRSSSRSIYVESRTHSPLSPLPRQSPARACHRLRHTPRTKDGTKRLPAGVMRVHVCDRRYSSVGDKGRRSV
jgi:hypothetical protein